MSVNFVQGDVTRLSSEDLGRDFAFIVDNGCLHGMSDDDRDDYVRGVTAAGARLLIVGFSPSRGLSVRRIDRAVIERRFALAWELVSSGDKYEFGGRFKIQVRSHLLQRNQ